jgi:hypothetical protein
MIIYIAAETMVLHRFGSYTCHTLVLIRLTAIRGFPAAILVGIGYFTPDTMPISSMTVARW